jgi:hypothetical protein
MLHVLEQPPRHGFDQLLLGEPAIAGHVVGAYPVAIVVNTPLAADDALGALSDVGFHREPARHLARLHPFVTTYA